MQPRRQASVVGSGNEPGRSGAVRLRLRCPSLGVDLLANPGDLLGRRYGPHVQVLERFSQISSRHLELGRGSDGRWTAKDLNSFNHSYYNGVQLVPEVAVALDAGGVLSLGDIALTVVLE